MQISTAGERVSAPWRSWQAAGAAALFLGASGGAWPQSADGSFAVTVELRAQVETASCDILSGPSQRSAIPAITCSRTPDVAPVRPAASPSDGRALRFHLPNGADGNRNRAVDLYAGAGTVTSWRVIHVADWDYFEMTVGW